MAKNKISEWSSTAANNTDIAGIDIAEGCAPSGINNAIRELMAQVKDQQTGTDADNFTVGGNLNVTGTTTATGAITANGGVTGNLTGNVTGNVTGSAGSATTATTATKATNIAGGGAGQVPYNSGADTTAFVAAGTSGQFLKSNGTSAPSWGDVYPLTSATAQASTSGTSIDFTGIPSWVKRITVMLSGVSTNGTSGKLIQLGDSGGIETTGYLGGSQLVQQAAGFSGLYSTSGFPINSIIATDILSGSMVFTLLENNIWTASGVFYNSSIQTGYCAGSKTLSSTLDRVRITTINGTDAFDAGSINIMYE